MKWKQHNSSSSKIVNEKGFNFKSYDVDLLLDRWLMQFQHYRIFFVYISINRVLNLSLNRNMIYYYA